MADRDLSYVVEYYGVPAEVGLRVSMPSIGDGVIEGGAGAHVAVRFDGEDSAVPCHPLGLDYGDGITPDRRTAHRNARIEAWNDRLNQRISADEYRERMSAPLVAEADRG